MLSAAKVRLGEPFQDSGKMRWQARGRNRWLPLRYSGRSGSCGKLTVCLRHSGWAVVSNTGTLASAARRIIPAWQNSQAKKSESSLGPSSPRTREAFAIACLSSESASRLPKLLKILYMPRYGTLTRYPNEIAKPSRGLFTPVTKSGNDTVGVGSTEQIASTGIKIKESEFYEPFAEWLKNDLDEVTEVVSLGGAGLKSKWGTPDVVGIYKPLASNLIKFPIEIISAEIKTDALAPVVAFGQAVVRPFFLL